MNDTHDTAPSQAQMRADEQLVLNELLRRIVDGVLGAQDSFKVAEVIRTIGILAADPALFTGSEDMVRAANGACWSHVLAAYRALVPQGGAR